MRRILLLAFATVLSLGACGDGGSSPVAATVAEPNVPPSFASGDAWTLFTNEVPNETLDATGGWEVGEQFYVTKPACVAALRFWRAAGETGTNRVKIWSNSGTLLASRIISSTGSGWQSEYFSSVFCLQPYTYYRVTVNTNVKQVKTFGAYSNGPIVNGIMVSTSGYYGQPAGSFPTTQSSSNFFADLVVVES
jgi:hypothetical protein